MGLSKLNNGVASIGIAGGLLELGRQCHKSICAKLESSTPLRVLVIAIHGPLDSRDEDCSAEMALRLETQIRSYFDPVLVTKMKVCSTGTTDERAKSCVEELLLHPERVSLCDLLTVVGHSQGGVVGMKVLRLLLDMSMAGVHGATTELALLNQAEHQGTVAYRRTLLRVLNAGVQVLAVHSFGDNLPSPRNLCLGLYLSKAHGSELGSSSEGWVPRLYQIYLRARNLGFVWHPSLAVLMEEADSFSKVAAQSFPLQMIFNLATRGYPSVSVSNNHSELVSCDALYAYATLWMVADTSNRPQNVTRDDFPRSLSYYTDTLDFILSELNRAQLFDSRLAPYTQPIRGELLQFRDDLKADLPDLKSRPSFTFYSRMKRLLKRGRRIKLALLF
ncbi:hypothetical protein L0F63_004550 [Massospora cicadina]|nr:hypothetical protein L0F63_004550 [Massospora cicadina]